MEFLKKMFSFILKNLTHKIDARPICIHFQSFIKKIIKGNNMKSLFNIERFQIVLNLL